MSLFNRGFHPKQTRCADAVCSVVSPTGLTIYIVATEKESEMDDMMGESKKGSFRGREEAKRRLTVIARVKSATCELSNTLCPCISVAMTWYLLD